MARYLALDTCTEICSVGLWDNGDLLTQRSLQPRQHTQTLLPMLDAVLAEAGYALGQLDGLFCTRGPGSFTGVRIGISAVQGLAYASGLPVWPVSALAVLAVQGRAQQPEITDWAVAMDARMGEAYVAVYRVAAESVPVITGQDESLLPLSALERSNLAGVTGRIGSAWALLDPAAEQVRSGQVPGSAALAHLPQASSVLTLGRCQVSAGVAPVAPEALQPVYLRNRVTH